ncbi:LPXTG cell wall anchor domain-containing protein (plasmid) [Enterococcus hirae]|uniref:LPXTG cell wall anchor domain-containing protein n=1 Tax=Enterococcus hirae TaxID=1354 RepID=UPI0016272520|nr:LPXTG cell wall anchor domain-containing protein [Enterococcus hirae]QNG06852.1 LPXTG cell wall anchor domain-containing protein [Enterococcus hirae]
MHKIRIKRHLYHLSIVFAFLLVFVSLPVQAETSQSTAVSVTFIRRITSENLPGNSKEEARYPEISIAYPNKYMFSEKLPQTNNSINYIFSGLGSSLVTLVLIGLRKKGEKVNEQNTK